MLREAIAKHVSFARAVACQAADIVVTSGSQQAFDLLARILVTPGRTVVAIENPGYPALRAALAAVGAKIVPVPVDGEGMIVEKLPARRAGDLRDAVASVSARHAMSMRRRTALLEFAQARNAVVIEDDYDGEFRFGGRPLDALQSLDRTESVFYIGTFSKSLFPGIRLGFVVAPPWAQRALVAAKQLRGHALRGDRAGHARSVHRGRTHGASRAQDARGLRRSPATCCWPVCGTISAAGWNRFLPSPDCTWRRSQNQRWTWTRSPSGHASWMSASIRCANYYFGGRAKPGLVFGYGAIEERDIVEGLSRLRRAWPK